MENWGKRVKLFGQKRFGTLGVFAEASDIHETQLSKYTKEHNYPSLAILGRWYDLGMSLDWLVSGHGSMLVESKNSPIPEATLTALRDTRQSLLDALVLVETQIKEGK